MLLRFNEQHNSLVKWNVLYKYNTLVNWRKFWCNRDCRKEWPSVDERKRQLDEWASSVDKKLKVTKWGVSDVRTSSQASKLRLFKTLCHSAK